MLITTFLLAAPSALAAPPELAYIGPNAYGDEPRWTGKADPANTRMTTYAPDERVFVATANANLRSAPSTSSSVVAKLPMGLEVVVGEMETREVVVGQKVDCWYAVTAGEHEGYLFGGTLTPLAARLDLDGAPGDEVITVSWAWDFELIVRTGPADGSTESEHRSSFGGDRKGGDARLRSLPEHGVAVVEVDLGSESAETTTWFHAMVVENGTPVERVSTYAHTHEGGARGFLAFDDNGTACSAFASRKSADVCVDLRTGTARKPPSVETLKSWTRIPAQDP